MHGVTGMTNIHPNTGKTVVSCSTSTANTVEIKTIRYIVQDAHTVETCGPGVGRAKRTTKKQMTIMKSGKIYTANAPRST